MTTVFYYLWYFYNLHFIYYIFAFTNTLISFSSFFRWWIVGKINQFPISWSSIVQWWSRRITYKSWKSSWRLRVYGKSSNATKAADVRCKFTATRWWKCWGMSFFSSLFSSISSLNPWYLSQGLEHDSWTLMKVFWK